jgi:hypothetical protein
MKPAEFVAFIASMNIAQLDGLAAAIAARKQELVDGAFMAGVLRDQRMNPVTAGLPPAERLRVDGAPTVTTAGGAGGWYEPRPTDGWKPPGQDIIDRAFPSHGKGGFNA